MDGDDRRASQYGPPYQPPGATRPPAASSMGPPTTDRFSQPGTPVRSDPTRHSMTRPYLPGYASYGFQDPQYAPPSMHSSSPMQGVEMQYTPTYVQDVSRQQSMGQGQSHQSYGQFPPGSILPSAPQPSMYESMPPYQQRQSAAIEVMSSQLGAVPQYLQQGEQGGMQISSSPSHYGSSQAEQSQYSTAGATRGALPSQYAQGSVDYTSMVGSQQPQQPPQPSQQSLAEQEALQEGLRQYRQQLSSTFESIMAGRVTEASEKLLPISRWLVGAVVSLGLHHDDETRYQERLGLWQNFNLCWEALGQNQRDITEQALQSGRQPHDILTAESIRRLVDELVAMCDLLEGHGLVDYEMGIAEEQICHIFTVCLDLLPRERQEPHPGQGRRPP